MTKITNIAKNTSYFTFALVLQKVLSFTYFTLIARALGPEDLGKYYFAISFAMIFSIFIDLGLSNVLTREVAKQKEKARELLGTVLALKLPLAALTLIILAALINFLGYPELTKNLVYISAFCVLLDSFSTSFFATIRGFHNLFFESISSVLFQLIVLIFGLTALYLNLGLLWLMGALAAASIFNFVYSFSLLSLKWKIKIAPIWDKTKIKFIFLIAIPFGLYAVFQRLFTYLDTVFLSYFSGDAQVGIYQIAFKIVFALQFLPLAFTASLYPVFASYWKENRDQLVITFERAMNYLIIISLPISVGVIALADKIVLLFKDSYTEAILPLRLVMIGLIFIFINYPVGSLLNGCDRQKTNTKNIAVALFLSVILNLILIPRLASVGAAITVIAANLLLFTLGMSKVSEIIKYRPKKILLPALKSILSAALMAVAAVYLKNYLNIFFIIIISGFVYFILLFLFKGFKREDVLSIWRSFR